MCLCLLKLACFPFLRGLINLYFTLFVTVDDRVIARWTDNLYYAGKISYVSEDGQLNVLFDDGANTIAHSITDISAVILDSELCYAQVGQHALAPREGSDKYYIGYVSDQDSSGRFMVTVDDNDEDIYYVTQLRIFPEHPSAHTGK